MKTDALRKIDAPLFAMIVICAAFAAYYVSVAAQHALNQDEGVYSVGALRFAEGDVMLTKADTDKPPLIYQILGLSAWAFGKTEMSVKIPNAVAIIILLWLVYALGETLFGKAEGVVAAMLVALSPFLGKTGIGAMTDPWAAVFLTGSLLLAFRGRAFYCGLVFAMALLVRQMALLYILLPLAALIFTLKTTEKNDDRPLWRLLGDFVFGFILPCLWLVIWSAAFERDKFQWLVRELSTGKVSSGAEKAGVGELLGFWMTTLGDFAFSWVVLVLAFVGAGILIAFRLLKKESPNQKSPAKTFAVILFFGAIAYYLTIHTALGAPKYARFMFPILPTCALLGGWLIAGGAKAVLPLHRESVRFAIWIVFGTAVVFGLQANAKALSVPQPRDDVPELARYLRTNAKDNAALFSHGLNRNLLFYMHKSRIKLGQHKSNPQNLLDLVTRHASRRQFVAFTKTDRMQLAQAEAALAPNYQLTPRWVSSRGFIRMYEVQTAARIAMEDSGPVFEFCGEKYPINKKTIEAGLTRFAKNALKSEAEPVVEAMLFDDGSILQGRLRAIRIRAADVALNKVPLTSLDVQYDEPVIDLGKLLGAGLLVVRKSNSARGEMVANTNGLSEFLQSKNRNIQDMGISTGQEGVTISGGAMLFVKAIPFQITGGLTVENGRVYFHPSSGQVAGISLPDFVLSAAERSINPAFDTRLFAFNMAGESVEVQDRSLTFVLR